VTKHSSSQGFQ